MFPFLRFQSIGTETDFSDHRQRVDCEKPESSMNPTENMPDGRLPTEARKGTAR